MNGLNYVVAAWGATGRCESTVGSDIDLLCWIPDNPSPDRDVLETEIANAMEHTGTYLDLAICDGKQSLGEWARSNATDLQAVLFATDVAGPPDLTGRFLDEQARLWGDEAIRAHEVWMLVSETLLHPTIMDVSGWFRPEKYYVGATRSWVTVGETYALLNGWSGRFTTSASLKYVEEFLGVESETLLRAYRRSVELRGDLERGAEFLDLVVEYQRLGELLLATIASLIESHIGWLQSNAGVDEAVLNSHFERLFGRRPVSSPRACEIHEPTDRMLRVFSAKSDDMIRMNLDFFQYDWFPLYAATANLNTSCSTLDEIAYPPISVDSWTHRNIRLWCMRHPNVSMDTARRVLLDPHSRPMDREAAQIVIGRIQST